MSLEKGKKYKYYEIKVSVRDTHPPVWRRLQIPSGIISRIKCNYTTSI